MIRVISLEGLPCSGKTTFYNNFNNDFFIKIPELYIEITEKDSNDSILKKYSDSEVGKYLNIKNSDKKFLISDRSFVSTLAFSYAKKLLLNKEVDWEYNLAFLKARKGEILIPELVVVFEIPVKVSKIKRVELGRKEDDNYWSNEFFLSYFSEFYKTNKYKDLFPETQTVFIDSYKQSELEVYIVVNEIITRFTKTISYKYNGEN